MSERTPAQPTPAAAPDGLAVVTITSDVFMPGVAVPDQISVAVPVGFVGQAAKYARAGVGSFVVILTVDGWEDETPVHRIEVHRT